MSETQDIQITYETTMWSVVPNFPNYEICELGDVRRIKEQTLLKQFKTNSGYLSVNLHNAGVQKTFGIHRLLALCFLPNPFNFTHVDHRNGNILDNRLENLRFVTKSQNAINSKKSAKSTSGVTGVNFHKHSGKWTSHISINGKLKNAYFDTKEDAVAHRKEMERLHYGEFVPQRDIIITVKTTSTNPNCQTENKLTLDDSSVMTDSTES